MGLIYWSNNQSRRLKNNFHGEIDVKKGEFNEAP